MRTKVALAIFTKILNDCKSGDVLEESIVMSCADALNKYQGPDWYYIHAAIRERFKTDEDPTGRKTEQRIMDLARNYMVRPKKDNQWRDIRVTPGDILVTSKRKLIPVGKARDIYIGSEYIGAIRDDIWIGHRDRSNIGTSAARQRLGPTEEATTHQAKVEAFIRTQHPNFYAHLPLYRLTTSYGYRPDIAGAINAGKSQ
jgi:hypothetical protein